MKSGDNVKKAVNIIQNFIVFALTLCLVVLRAVQLCRYTDKYGLIVKGAESTIIAYYVLSLLLFALSLVFFCRRGRLLQQDDSLDFFNEKSQLLCLTSVFAGVSMFADFIFRVILSYNYISGTPGAKLNYFIPLCVSAVFSLLCAFYFIAVGISFNSDKYVFKDFRYLHIIPLLWAVSVLCTCLTENVDAVYGEEKLLHYIVLIFAIVFYILFITSADGITGFAPLCGFATVYGLFAVVMALPRFIAFICKVDFGYSDFSSVSYLFTGFFALAVSAVTSGRKKKD